MNEIAQTCLSISSAWVTALKWANNFAATKPTVMVTIRIIRDMKIARRSIVLGHTLSPLTSLQQFQILFFRISLMWTQAENTTLESEFIQNILFLKDVNVWFCPKERVIATGWMWGWEGMVFQSPATSTAVQLYIT